MNRNQNPWPCLKCMVIMEAKDEDHCKCPICGTEVWYEYDEEEEIDEIEELMQDSINRHNKNPDFTILGGPPAKGGGGSNKGRSKKKQLLQKPSTTELYRRLNGYKVPNTRRKRKPKKSC